MLIENKFPNIKLIKNKENMGFAKANNIALKTINSKYAFFLNPDTILLNNSIKILVDFLEDNHDIACTGANLYKQDLSLQFSYGNFPTIKKVLFEFGLNKIFKAYFNTNLSESITFNYDEPKEVPYITGADLLIRKDVLDNVGYFNEDFFLYYEETELQFRIRKADYKIFLNPLAKIIHFSNTSLNLMSSYNKVKTIEKSRALYYKKVYSHKISILIKILYLIKYILQFLFRKKNITENHIRVMLELLKDF